MGENFLLKNHRGQPAASQALGRVMDATAVCDKAKLPNYPDQAWRLVGWLVMILGVKMLTFQIFQL